MSSQKTSNNDSCRDLNGRRLSTVKEANRMAEYIENEPARKKAVVDAQRAKLEALERQLGIDPSAASGSSSVEPAKVAGTKHRFDDTEYLDQSRELVDGVKSAVAAGLLKKRKKAKTAAAAAAAAAASDAPTALDKVVKSIVEAPATAIMAVTAGAVVGTAITAK